MPVAASTLAANPDQFVGMTVTLTAAVDQRYGGTAFSVDQDRATSAGQDVLVLAPLLNAPVEANAYVTVIGEVVRFDAADAAARMKDAMPVLAPDVAAKYRGRAAIIATSVINGAMTDLAKRLPPPMTPEELALSKVMKQVGPGFTALRQSVDREQRRRTPPRRPPRSRNSSARPPRSGRRRRAPTRSSGPRTRASRAQPSKPPPPRGTGTP